MKRIFLITFVAVYALLPIFPYNIGQAEVIPQPGDCDFIGPVTEEYYDEDGNLDCE